MAVTVTVDFPPDIEQKVRAETPDVPGAVREAFAIHLFRQGVLRHYDLGRVLGLDRYETDAFLKKHQVFEQSLTEEDLEADRGTLDRILGPARP